MLLDVVRMDALKVYDVRKICDARLYIVDMVAAFVRALATVLLMGRVAVLGPGEIIGELTLFDPG
ncbi:hypothetical protein C0Z14_03185, partial [Rothia aeria]